MNISEPYSDLRGKAYCLNAQGRLALLQMSPDQAVAYALERETG